MRRVIVESPYAGTGPWPLSWWRRWRNIRYARAAVRDSLLRGEAPHASHLLYPQVLDDGMRHERRWGMEAGWAWGETAEITAVYMDLGISPGMEEGLKRAKREGRAVEYRWFRAKPRQLRVLAGRPDLLVSSVRRAP